MCVNQRQSSQLRRQSVGRGPQLTPGIGTMVRDGVWITTEEVIRNKSYNVTQGEEVKKIMWREEIVQSSGCIFSTVGVFAFIQTSYVSFLLLVM